VCVSVSVWGARPTGARVVAPTGACPTQLRFSRLAERDGRSRKEATVIYGGGMRRRRARCNGDAESVRAFLRCCSSSISVCSRMRIPADAAGSKKSAAGCSWRFNDPSHLSERSFLPAMRLIVFIKTALVGRASLSNVPSELGSRAPRGCQNVPRSGRLAPRSLLTCRDCM